jgi:hypothetical protein
MGTVYQFPNYPCSPSPTRFFLSLEDLIKNKRAVGCDRDLPTPYISNGSKKPKRKEDKLFFCSVKSIFSAT